MVFRSILSSCSCCDFNSVTCFSYSSSSSLNSFSFFHIVAPVHEFDHPSHLLQFPNFLFLIVISPLFSLSFFFTIPTVSVNNQLRIFVCLPF
eukprot:UN25231